MRRASTLVFLLAAVLLLTACPWRMMGEDAKRGAEIGWRADGPLGTAIGIVVSVVSGLYLRSREKKSLRRKGLLTDRRTAETVRTERPAPPPQSHFPTDV